MKRILGLLILLVVGLSFYMNMFMRKTNSDEDVSIDKIEIEFDDTTSLNNNFFVDLLESSEDNFKQINYSVMNFFKKVNEGDANLSFFLDYLDFYGKEHLPSINELKELKNVFYEIKKISFSNNKYYCDIIYKEKESKSLNTITLTTDGRYIAEGYFVKVENVNYEYNDSRFTILVDKVMIFKDKEIYKFKIINLTNDFIDINNDMYGFYGKDRLNKYYHTLVGESNDYSILPMSAATFFVEFKGRDIDNIYVNILGEDIQIKKFNNY